MVRSHGQSNYECNGIVTRLVRRIACVSNAMAGLFPLRRIYTPLVVIMVARSNCKRGQRGKHLEYMVWYHQTIVY